MAIDAKISFMRKLEENCADKMTMTNIQQMMVIVSDVLEGYDMRERSAWGEEETDDLMESFMASMQIQTVARLLGHEKIETTMEYVMLKKEDMKSDYRRYA